MYGMSNAEISALIEEAFPGCASAFSDEFIEANPDLSLLEEPADFQFLVPAYMAWCVRNGHRPEELVHDYTLRALAEFGRAKSTAAHMNFKQSCSSGQRKVVAAFLRWCLNPELLLDAEQAERSLKRWASV